MGSTADGRIDWYRRLLKVEPPAVRPSEPRLSPERAKALFAVLSADDDGIPVATRSQLFEPDGPSDITIVMWHGFTNAPSQFSAVAPALARAGYRVLVPRMPYHGQADLLTRELGELRADELTAQVDACVEIAAGLGSQVWVVGLSAGGTLAAWAAATRSEVSRVALLAPLAAPVGFPMPVVRTLVKWPRLVPNFYMWWDPRKKAGLVAEQSPYAYPGFAVPGLFPFLRMSEALLDRSVVPGHALERMVLVTNPGDFAIRKDVARELAFGVFAPVAEVAAEATIDGALKWMHDFVDPWGVGGTPEQVAGVLLAALGVGDPAAGGVLVEPLVDAQPL